jgi:hypothetical protein
MPMIRLLRLCVARMAAILALLCLTVPAGADERADLHAALEQATAQYRIVLNTLENKGREETAAEVARFRAAFQVVIDRFDANRAAFAGERDYAGLFMQIDARIVGAMIVIDFASRETARAALAPIADALAELSARSTPPK